MHKSLIFLAVAASSLASSAHAAEPSGTDKLDRCLRSINVIGASVGHAEMPGPGGKPMLHFLVRSNGSEYDVICEADTGMVKDVSLRMRPETQTN